MERLTAQQRAAVGKMSDDRLRLRLVQAGYQAEDVGRLDRQGLLQTYAACLADEEDEKRARAAAEAEGPEMFAEAAAAVFGEPDPHFMVEQEVTEAVNVQQVAGDDHPPQPDAQQGAVGGEQGDGAQAAAMSLEERRLRLEERRLQMEEQQWQAELAAKERKEKAELEEKKAERKLKQQELDLKREIAEKEERHKDTPAVKLKLWGDALRNTISRMPNEPIEIVSWFASLDHLFNQLCVPDDLRAILVRPYLNDRAKNLLSRCDPSKSQDYKVVKKFLLQELQLTPSVYLEKFNSETKSSNETYHQFGNRLTALFDYYVEARQVNNNYDRLAQLMIYDRIKSSLPPFLSRHVLSLEAPLAEKGGWLGRQELIDALDAYVAGMNGPPKSILTTDNRSKGQKSVSAIANKLSSDNSTLKNGNKFTTENKGQGQVVTPRPVMAKRCFGCGSLGHLLNTCPERRSTFTGGKSNVQSKQVSHCAVEISQHTGRSDIATTCVRDQLGLASDVLSTCCDAGVQVADLPARHEFGGVDVCTQCDDCTQTDISSSRLDVEKSNIHNSVMDDEKLVDAYLTDGWSELRYLDVSIDGISNVIRALDDSGAQICLIRTDMITSMNLPRIGKVILRDFLGNSHEAEVVTLQMKLADAETFVPVVCAVCDKLSNDLLLGSDVVDRLNRVWLSDQSQMPADISDVYDVDNSADISENRDVNTDVMNNDVSAVTSPVINDDDDDDDTVLNPDDVTCDKSKNVADAEQLALEQQSDKSLALCFSLAKRGKGGYFSRDGILYRKDKILGHEVEQLCLPVTRRSQAIRLAHQTYGGHLASRKTKARLKLSFTWPTIAADVQDACEKCEVCQKCRRVTVYDRVPISPVPNNEVVFC